MCCISDRSGGKKASISTVFLLRRTCGNELGVTSSASAKPHSIAFYKFSWTKPYLCLSAVPLLYFTDFTVCTGLLSVAVYYYAILPLMFLYIYCFFLGCCQDTTCLKNKPNADPGLCHPNNLNSMVLSLGSTAHDIKSLRKMKSGLMAHGFCSKTPEIN